MRVLQAYWLYLTFDYFNAQGNMDPVVVQVHEHLINVLMKNQTPF